MIMLIDDSFTFCHLSVVITQFLRILIKTIFYTSRNILFLNPHIVPRMIKNNNGIIFLHYFSFHYLFIMSFPYGKPFLLNFNGPNKANVLSNVQCKNCWDSAACHSDLEITDDKCLTVHYKENEYGRRSVFAKPSIFPDSDSSDISYFEVFIKAMKHIAFIGLAEKQQQISFDERIHCGTGIYEYTSGGYILLSGTARKGSAKYSFGVGDIVGCGVNLAAGQIFFTKNGHLLDASQLLFSHPHPASSSSSSSVFDLPLVPFVSLFSFDDKIEANFGPNFEFDLSILC